ncbi:unnamed protein product, partial [Arabidopsis halleri]
QDSSLELHLNQIKKRLEISLDVFTLALGRNFHLFSAGGMKSRRCISVIH